jgi:hypothetical protein
VVQVAARSKPCFEDRDIDSNVPELGDLEEYADQLSRERTMTIPNNDVAYNASPSPSQEGSDALGIGIEVDDIAMRDLIADATENVNQVDNE